LTIDFKLDYLTDSFYK